MREGENRGAVIQGTARLVRRKAGSGSESGGRTESAGGVGRPYQVT